MSATPIIERDINVTVVRGVRMFLAQWRGWRGNAVTEAYLLSRGYVGPPHTWSGLQQSAIPNAPINIHFVTLGFRTVASGQ